MMNQRRWWLCLFPLFCTGLSTASAERADWTAGELFEQCLTEGLILTKDKSALVLAMGTVVEDDGPAAGYSYSPNLETLDGKKWLRKTLIVHRRPARRAMLLVAQGGDLKFQLNGRPLAITEQRQLGPYWQGYEFDPDLLKAGENEVIVTGEGKIWIARDDEYARGSLTRTRHPNQSAKSTDAGKTWNADRLGDRDNVDGEYCLRLWLDQSVPEGTLVTPVLDAGNLTSTKISPPLAKWGSVRLGMDFEQRSDIQVRVRSGSSAFVNADWTSWSPVALSQKGTAEIAELKGRYFQLSCTLKSPDPLSSPLLRGLRLESDPEFAGDWATSLKILAEDNPPILRGSIAFQHEDSRHPSLQKLRRDYELDKLIAGARSEFEVITRLARWSSARWPKLGHLGEAYPPWNALEILKEHADGTPVGGFCHQYNIVFLQACQSLGIPGRVVSIGPSLHADRIRSGHETVEVWSNDYQKWVYVDGNTAWYFTHPETKVPLSLWELRQAQLDAFEGKNISPPVLVKIAETRYEWKGLEGFPAFLELRLVPRSNFLSQDSPLPLNQGMRGWFWTGYRVWSDHRLPAREIYPHRVTKRRNFEWPVNCLHITLEPQKEPGRVRVHVDVEMPNFRAILAKIDEKPEQPAKQTFEWRLKPGRNRLQLTPINQSDRRGRTNRIEIQYQPGGR